MIRGEAAQLTLLSVGVVLAMSLWFSASAMVPQLEREWGLDSAAGARLTMSVQLGFAAGALAGAVLDPGGSAAPGGSDHG